MGEGGEEKLEDEGEEEEGEGDSDEKGEKEVVEEA